MNAEAAIRSSRWWQAAQAMHDRHRPDDTRFSVADHLEAVLANLRRLLAPDPPPGFRRDLAVALTAIGLAPAGVLAVLTPVALLHDVGKPAEDREAQTSHPLTGRPVGRGGRVRGRPQPAAAGRTVGRRPLADLRR
jgi:hypothetical protein